MATESVGPGGGEGEDPGEARRLEILRRRLKEHRERYALTQEEFAEICGLSRSQVANIERGAYPPGKSTRRKLAAALGLRVEELFTPSD